MAALATVQDLRHRVNEPIDTAEDIALAQTLLDLVSAEVRAIGDPWPDPALAPAVAKAVTIRAAARGFMNPDGTKMERADMLTLQWSEAFSQGEMLLPQEIRLIQSVSMNQGSDFVSIPLQRDVIISDASVFNDATSGGGYDASF